MPASVRLSGLSGVELRYVAGQLRKAAAKDLKAELRKAQRKALSPLQKEIKAEALATLPKRGRYNVVMSKAVKVAILGTGTARLQARVYAIGKKEQRDVRAVNAGILRHPVFGNRKNWATTRVKRGFVDHAFDRVADRMLDEAGQAVQVIIDKIARG